MTYRDPERQRAAMSALDAYLAACDAARIAREQGTISLLEYHKRLAKAREAYRKERNGLDVS